MGTRILHCLSQRPLLTGSGVTLDALARRGDERGYEQRIVVGVPFDETVPDRFRPLRFGDARADLPYPVPGMSDVMPYRSTVFSSLSAEERRSYRDAWREHLERVLEEFRPDLIHTHHAWILTSLLKELRPSVPVVVHTHGTALRQRTLCPDAVPEIRDGIRAVDRLLALHEGHAAGYADAFEVPRERIRVVGTGYRTDVFHPRGRTGNGSETLLYAGKLSASKGVPELLDAFAQIRGERPTAILHLAGGGAGREANAIRNRATSAPGVVVHGRLDQVALADLARQSAVFVLPSFYEGLPLVLAEALACGCRLVATALPGVVEGLAPGLGPALETVPVPRMAGIDVPVGEDRPEFVRGLVRAVRRALDAPPPDPALATPFTWDTVLDRVEAVWRELVPLAFEEMDP